MESYLYYSYNMIRDIFYYSDCLNFMLRLLLNLLLIAADEICFAKLAREKYKGEQG